MLETGLFRHSNIRHSNLIRHSSFVLRISQLKIANIEMDELRDIPDERFPRHIAVIMDGNGRWAIARGLERVRGHQEGAKTVRTIVTECARLRKERGGPEFLPLYSFSLENWARPSDEVTFLMQTYIEYLRSARS